jgi:hypothetical protein
MMKKLLLLTLCLVGMTGMVFSQSTPVKTEEWKFVKETSGVKLYSQKGLCSGHDVMFLKLVNTNKEMVEVAVEQGAQNGIVVSTPTASTLTIISGREAVGSCTQGVSFALIVQLQANEMPEISLTVTKH